MEENNNIDTIDTIETIEPTQAPVEPVEPAAPVAPVEPTPVAPVAPATSVAPQQNTVNIPEEYKPITMWGYFGYELLFAIPLIGFIFLLVYAFGSGNINRRNFARSYFCFLIIGLVIGVLVLIFAALFGFSFAALRYN